MNLKLSKIAEDGSIKISPIRQIMEMAERENLVRMGLNPAEVISFAGGWVNHEAPEELRVEYEKLVSTKELFHNIGGYSPTEGSLELRKLLADMARELYGTQNLTEENIIVGQSSTQLIFSLFPTILNPNDSVLLFDPTYANYVEQVHVCQRKKNIIYLDVFDKDAWSFVKDDDAVLEELESILKKHRPRIILISSPDNPTGRIPSDTFVLGTLDVARKYGAFVVIDNAYSLQYFTSKQPKHFSLSPRDFKNLIKIYSNSKWCRGLGRRMGWVEADSSVIDAVKAIQQTMILCPDTLHQVAMQNYLKTSIKSGSLTKYFEESRLKYKSASEFTTECIEHYLKMRYLKPQGGLYVVVDAGVDGSKFVHSVLKNTGVIFVPGEGFGKSLKNGVRVSFGPLVNNLNKIEEGFSRVGKFLNR